MKPAPPVMRIVSVTGRSLSSALFIVAFEQLGEPARLAVRRLVLVQESGVVRLAPRPSVVSHVCGGCLAWLMDAASLTVVAINASSSSLFHVSPRAGRRASLF